MLCIQNQQLENGRIRIERETCVWVVYKMLVLSCMDRACVYSCEYPCGRSRPGTALLSCSLPCMRNCSHKDHFHGTGRNKWLSSSTDVTLSQWLWFGWVGVLCNCTQCFCRNLLGMAWFGKFLQNCCGPGRRLLICIFGFWLLVLAGPHNVSHTWQQRLCGLKAFVASLSHPAQLEHCNRSSLFLFWGFSQHLVFGKTVIYFYLATCWRSLRNHRCCMAIPWKFILVFSTRLTCNMGATSTGLF